jgi:hypothetical protein
MKLNLAFEMCEKGKLRPGSELVKVKCNQPRWHVGKRPIRGDGQLKISHHVSKGKNGGKAPMTSYR